MSAVKRDFKRWLARVEAMASVIRPADLEEAHHRQTLRMRVHICELIRERLLLMGLDPALAASLQIGKEAAAELAAIPDTERLRSADEAITRRHSNDCGEVRSKVEAQIQRIAANMCEGFQPDFANASLAELLAFCVAIENLAWGDQYGPPEDIAEFG